MGEATDDWLEQAKTDSSIVNAVELDIILTDWVEANHINEAKSHRILFIKKEIFNLT